MYTARLTPYDVSIARMGAQPLGLGWRITGQIKNGNQRFLLHSLQVLLTVRDSPTPKPDFNDPHIITEEKVYIDLEVPPGQTCDFESFALMEISRPKQGLAWSWKVLSVR